MASLVTVVFYLQKRCLCDSQPRSHCAYTTVMMTSSKDKTEWMYLLYVPWVPPPNTPTLKRTA